MTDDPQEHPAKVERVYVRRDRAFTALDEVRCPVCGATYELEKGREMKWCSGDKMHRSRRWARARV